MPGINERDEEFIKKLSLADGVISLQSISKMISTNPNNIYNTIKESEIPWRRRISAYRIYKPRKFKFDERQIPLWTQAMFCGRFKTVRRSCAGCPYEELSFGSCVRKGYNAYGSFADTIGYIIQSSEIEE